VESLGITPASTSWRSVRRVGRRMEKFTESLDFQDWTINGAALRDLVTRRGDAPVPHRPVQEMTWLCEHEPWPAGAVDNLQRLLGQQPGDFPNGRVSVLVCPIDSDLGCAALSVELVMDADTVQWRDLAWQVDYEALDPAEDLLEPPQSYRFRRDEYTRLLCDLLAHYELLVHTRTTAQATDHEPAGPRRGRWLHWRARRP
jgi:hypothetical protein